MFWLDAYSQVGVALSRSRDPYRAVRVYSLPSPPSSPYFAVPVGPQQRPSEPSRVAAGAYPQTDESVHPPSVWGGHQPHRVGHDLLPHPRDLAGAAGHSQPHVQQVDVTRGDARTCVGASMSWGCWGLVPTGSSIPPCRYTSGYLPQTFLEEACAHTKVLGRERGPEENMCNVCATCAHD